MAHFSGRHLAPAAAAIALGAVLIAGTGAPLAQARSSTPASTTAINGQGSTFIQPLMARWAFEYRTTVDKYTSINYQGTGSGAGKKAFISKLVDFAGTDAFATDAEIKSAGGDVLNIPMALGPVALTYNLPGFRGNLQLDGPTLAQIFEGKITNWSDPKIASLNKGLTLPNQTIQTVHRADASGTSFIFTSYLTAVDSYWKANVGASTAVNWPAGQGAKGTAGVAQVVSTTPGGLGYVELSYAINKNLPTIAIKNSSGNYVAPSIAGAAADAAGFGNLPSDLRAVIVNASGKNTYPITGFSWVLVHQHAENAADSSKYPALLKFLWWAIHSGQRWNQYGSLRYAPLPANIVKADEAKIKSVTLHGKAVYNG